MRSIEIMATRNSYVLFLSALCIGAALAEITIDNWTYEDGTDNTGQDYWADIDGSFCDGTKQSPINIVTGNAKVYKNIPEFDVDSYDTDVEAVLENNGHALEIDLGRDTHNYDISGGGLVGTFRAVQFHFHFGSDGDQGSEHTLDGEQYPAEMHIVHYDTSYNSPGEALANTGGVAVLGFFLEETDSDNDDLEIIIKNIQHVEQPHTHHDLEDLNLSEIIPSNLDKFWRYSGSLTTPRCNEVVTWTLFKETIKISTQQLATMRTLYSEATDANQNKLKMENNFRAIQKKNNRLIQFVTVGDDDDDGTHHVSVTPTASAGRMVPHSFAISAAFVAALSVFRF